MLLTGSLGSWLFSHLQESDNILLETSHEPPVVAGPVRILYDGRLPGNDGQTLVVEKPGSMPVRIFVFVEKVAITKGAEMNVPRYTQREGITSTPYSQS